MSLNDLKGGCDLVSTCLGLNGHVMALGVGAMQPWVVMLTSRTTIAIVWARAARLA